MPELRAWPVHSRAVQCSLLPGEGRYRARSSRTGRSAEFLIVVTLARRPPRRRRVIPSTPDRATAAWGSAIGPEETTQRLPRRRPGRSWPSELHEFRIARRPSTRWAHSDVIVSAGALARPQCDNDNFSSSRSPCSPAKLHNAFAAFGLRHWLSDISSSSNRVQCATRASHTAFTLSPSTGSS